jgi:hypothetical protein
MEWALCQKVTAHLNDIFMMMDLDTTDPLFKEAMKDFQYTENSDAAERMSRGNDIGRHVLPYARLEALRKLWQKRLPQGMF